LGARAVEEVAHERGADAGLRADEPDVGGLIEIASDERGQRADDVRLFGQQSPESLVGVWDTQPISSGLSPLAQPLSLPLVETRA